MPIYEYECEKCGNKFENYYWFVGADKDIKCPKCGIGKPKRIVSSTNKGSSDNSCAPRRSG